MREERMRLAHAQMRAQARHSGASVSLRGAHSALREARGLPWVLMEECARTRPHANFHVHGYAHLNMASKEQAEAESCARVGYVCSLQPSSLVPSAAARPAPLAACCSTPSAETEVGSCGSDSAWTWKARIRAERADLWVVPSRTSWFD